MIFLSIEQLTEAADFTNRFTNVRRDYRSFGINTSTLVLFSFFA